MLASDYIRPLSFSFKLQGNSGILRPTHFRNEVEFGLQMYPAHLQNWLDFGHGLHDSSVILTQQKGEI